MIMRPEKIDTEASANTDDTDVSLHNTSQEDGSIKSERSAEFVPLSKEEEKACLDKILQGVKTIMEKTSGMLYLERYESFVLNKWPYDVKRGHLCHPKALSLAGLAFHALEPTPSAQCQVCLEVFSNLKHNSNPWIMHSEKRPDCYLVSLGQRDEVDDYTIDEVTEMACRKILAEAEHKLKHKEDRLKRLLYMMMQKEKGKNVK